MVSSDGQFLAHSTRIICEEHKFLSLSFRCFQIGQEKDGISAETVDPERVRKNMQWHSNFSRSRKGGTGGPCVLSK